MEKQKEAYVPNDEAARELLKGATVVGFTDANNFDKEIGGLVLKARDGHDYTIKLYYCSFDSGTCLSITKG